MGSSSKEMSSSNASSLSLAAKPTHTELSYDVEKRMPELILPVPVKDDDGTTTEDVNLISFTNPPALTSDASNPLEWSQSRRYTTTLLISLCGLVSLMTTSVIAPALPTIASDLALSPASTSLTLSIYLLAFAFGPLLIGPLSEVYGRRPLWLICHAYFIIWNTLCPVGRSMPMMVVGRFMAGLGGSIGIALPGPIMADIWKIEERGKSITLSMFMPYFGAAVGPILGGYMCEQVSWPWLFWVVSIFDTVLLVVSFFVIKESYAPLLLLRKASRLANERGKPQWTIYQTTNKTAQKGTARVLTALQRPFKLFITRPTIPLISFFVGYMFGCYTIALTCYAEVWTHIYHQSISASGLHYIAISIGSAGSSLITGFLMDKVFRYLKSRSPNQTSRPEFRVPLMVPGTIICPIGLLIYGWSSQRHLHWIITDLGMVLAVSGSMSSSQCANAYMVDEFMQEYASAGAAMRFWSNVLGFVFPLFAPTMYQRLGYGVGNTVLAAGMLILCVPVPAVLWWFGERIRAIGKRRD